MITFSFNKNFLFYIFFIIFFIGCTNREFTNMAFRGVIYCKYYGSVRKTAILKIKLPDKEMILGDQYYLLFDKVEAGDSIWKESYTSTIYVKKQRTGVIFSTCFECPGYDSSPEATEAMRRSAKVFQNDSILPCP